MGLGPFRLDRLYTTWRPIMVVVPGSVFAYSRFTTPGSTGPPLDAPACGLRRVHAVHHASHPPTAWAAMSFHPWETLTGAVVIPALIMTIPIHLGALAAVLTIMTVMGVTNHMGGRCSQGASSWFSRQMADNSEPSSAPSPTE